MQEKRKKMSNQSSYQNQPISLKTTETQLGVDSLDFYLVLWPQCSFPGRPALKRTPHSQSLSQLLAPHSQRSGFQYTQVFRSPTFYLKVEFYHWQQMLRRLAQQEGLARSSHVATRKLTKTILKDGDVIMVTTFTTSQAFLSKTDVF